MAGQSSVLLVWSWTYLNVLGSQLFGQASVKSCDGFDHCQVLPGPMPNVVL